MYALGIDGDPTTTVLHTQPLDVTPSGLPPTSRFCFWKALEVYAGHKRY